MESVEHTLGALRAALHDFVQWLRADSTPSIVIGGVAVALLAKPRITKDVDGLVLLPEEKWPDFLTQGEAFGFVPRISDPLAFAFQSRVLLLTHKPTEINADVSLGLLAFEEQAIARAITIRALGIDVPLPTPEDLVVMKAVVSRPRDIADIEAVLDIHDVDQERIRHWVQALSDVMEAPELYINLDGILRQHSQKMTRRANRKKRN